MKGASILVLIASFLAYQVQSLGICYDPKHVAKVTPDVIKKDMKQLKDMGFTAIRTYSTGDNMGEFAMEAGLDVALGIPLGVANVEAEIANAIKLATSQTGPGKVKVIFVGNENYADKNHKVVQDNMVAMIKRIKQQVPGVKVGTVQRQSEFLEHKEEVKNMAALVEAVDVIGVNIHPLFGESPNGKAGIESLNAQWNAMKGLDSKYPGLSKKLALTEIGWPSGGRNNASPQIALDFYKGYMEWSSKVSEEQYYFQAYDQPGRGQGNEGEFEKFFGIIDKDGKPKYPDVQVVGGKTTNTSSPDPQLTAPRLINPGPNTLSSPSTPTNAPSEIGNDSDKFLKAGDAMAGNDDEDSDDLSTTDDDGEDSDDLSTARDGDDSDDLSTADDDGEDSDDLSTARDGDDSDDLSTAGDDDEDSDDLSTSAPQPPTKGPPTAKPPPRHNPKAIDVNNMDTSTRQSNTKAMPTPNGFDYSPGKLGQ